MSVAATKVEFDSDGLPIPKGYNVPAKTVNKSTIQFDGDGLPIPQKKNDGVNGLQPPKNLFSPTKSQSQNGSLPPMTLLPNTDVGGKIVEPLITPDALTINKAANNYLKGQTTGEDLSVLADTQFGKENGLDNIQPDKRDITANAYNIYKQNDVTPKLENVEILISYTAKTDTKFRSDVF